MSGILVSHEDLEVLKDVLAVRLMRESEISWSYGANGQAGMIDSMQARNAIDELFHKVLNLEY